MATWAEIQTYIRKNYESRELENGAMTLTFRGDTNRTQQVIVEPNNDEGTWVVFRGIVSDWSPENAVKALESNTQIFGLERFLDWVAITHAQLTETADVAEIDRALVGVALAADTLEQVITGQDEF